MRVLFVHNNRSKFVKNDLKILRNRYDVKEVYVRGRFINLLGAIIDIWKSDIIFAWFASWHSFFYILFSKLLRRPSIVVAGGYDVVNMPEIGYGLMRGGIKKMIAKYILQSSTIVLCVSKSNKEEAVKNAGIVNEKIHMIYHGVECEEAENNFIKEKLVITVGNVTISNLKRKGLEGFVRAAKYLPDIPFVVIGEWKDRAIDYLTSIATPNVNFLGFVDDEKLYDHMRRAKVYVQVSAHEGFGLSVAEAMLFECIPVVTRVGSLPEVVEETGIYVPFDKPEEIADGIRNALSLSNDLGKQARERVIRIFPLIRRKEEIYKIVDELVFKDG